MMLNFWCETVGVLPPNLVVLQYHHRTVLTVLGTVGWVVISPGCIRYGVIIVNPQPVTLSACVMLLKIAPSNNEC